MRSNDYRCCSYCKSFLKDLSHKFLFEHQTEDKFCCTNEKCMYEYLLETHSKLNLIVNR